jgi:hypothetical protein
MADGARTVQWPCTAGPVLVIGGNPTRGSTRRCSGSHHLASSHSCCPSLQLQHIYRNAPQIMGTCSSAHQASSKQCGLRTKGALAKIQSPRHMDKQHHARQQEGASCRHSPLYSVSTPHRRSGLARILVQPHEGAPHARSYMQSLTLADPLGLREHVHGHRGKPP